MISCLKNKQIILLTLFCFCCGFLFSQQDSIISLPENSEWLNVPANITDSIEYDYNTETHFITKYVGGHPISTPQYFSTNEYQDYLFNKKFNEYWKQKITGQNSDSELGKVKVGEKILLVFYSPNNQNYWDGRNQGKDMPTADYFYIINNSDGVNLSHGRVTLRR